MLNAENGNRKNRKDDELTKIDSASKKLSQMFDMSCKLLASTTNVSRQDIAAKSKQTLTLLEDKG